MRTRRELLIMGGAGVAAIAVPSFFPTTRSIAFAKADPDPMLAEIVLQLQRAVTGLGANPPKGSARQLAAIYRMASAWARSNNLDAVVRERLDAALASEGHHALVTRLAAVDVVAEAKRRGLPVPPTMRTPDTTAIAKAIGIHKGGFTYELAWRLTAQRMVKQAAKFDRMMAAANGRNPTDATIRLVQEPVCTDPDCSSEEWEPTGDCVQNPDGSFSCNLVATAPSQTAPDGNPPPSEQQCHTIDFIFDIFQSEWAILAAFIPEMWFLAIVLGIGFEFWEWYIGC